MAYDRDRYDRDRYDRDRYERDRGPFDRASDEVRSWFGDDEARRRRERDERYGERGSNPDRTYGERDFSRGDREDRWTSEPVGKETYRDYSDRYGRTYSSAIDRDREREIGRGPAFQPYARGASTSATTGSQEFGPEGYGSAASYGWTRGYGREWRTAEQWRVPGPYAGRGPKGYQRSDERIREELSDRLTAHGHIDASDVEVRVQGAEVTLIGFVDSREAKRLAEDLAEDVQGVREVHNQLRIRTHADDTGVGRTSVLGLTERETQTADTANRSRTRNP